MEKLEGYLKKDSEFKGANWLTNSLAIVAITRITKPPNIEDAEAFGLPMTFWFFVAWGELFAGILLFVGGLTIALRSWRR